MIGEAVCQNNFHVSRLILTVILWNRTFFFFFFTTLQGRKWKHGQVIQLTKIGHLFPGKDWIHTEVGGLQAHSPDRLAVRRQSPDPKVGVSWPSAWMPDSTQVLLAEGVFQPHQLWGQFFLKKTNLTVELRNCALRMTFVSQKRDRYKDITSISFISQCADFLFEWEGSLTSWSLS